MPVPVFSVNEVLTSAAMNVVGLWRISTCTVTSAGGTAATASNGVVTIGTGNTSVTVSNAFSSSYQNYRIIIEVQDSNGAGQVTLAFDGITTSTYFTGGSFGSWGVSGQSGYGITASTNFQLTANDAAGTGSRIILDITNPNISRRKYGNSNGQSGNGHATFNLYSTSSSTATGFVVAKQGNTMTGGTIRVYGYNN